MDGVPSAPLVPAAGPVHKHIHAVSAVLGAMMSSPSSASAPSGPPPDGHPPVRRLKARHRHESHRVATPLELFFDLCFVVAIAQAGVQLVHAVAQGHAGEGVLHYAMVFFAIWCP
ncbi:hypothetical protein GCM10010330_44940 [Streptomyces tendae]|nr:hypothetical protein GCM10010330_44940 [Streptomyces tendae]